MKDQIERVMRKKEKASAERSREKCMVVGVIARSSGEISRNKKKNKSFIKIFVSREDIRNSSPLAG